MKVWKIPSNIDIKIVKELKGLENSSLNPIQDANGNWVISQEEYNTKEFEEIRKKYEEVIKTFELIEYKPKNTEKNYDLP